MLVLFRIPLLRGDWTRLVDLVVCEQQGGVGRGKLLLSGQVLGTHDWMRGFVGEGAFKGQTEFWDEERTLVEDWLGL